MKRKYFFLLGFALLFFGKVEAQSIPNPGFENWSTITFDNPEFWVTLNPLSTFPFNNPISAYQTTGADAYSGSYALKVKTIVLSNNPLPGSLPDVLGVAFAGTATDISNVINGYSYSGRPDTMTFYYKYIPQSGDSGLCYVSFTRYDALLDSTILIGDGFYPMDTLTSNFTNAIIAIDYYNSDIPDTASITFLSSASSSPIPDSYLIVDELMFSDALPTVSQIEQDTLLYDLYSVTSAQTVSVNVVSWNDDTNLSGATVDISTNYQSGEDSLSFTSMFGITGSFSTSTGTLTLSGAATFDNYKTVLRTVKYKHYSATTTTSVRKVEFMVTDGVDDSNVASRHISVYNSTGIENISDKEYDIHVFPSPAKDEITISGIPSGAKNAEVFDILGNRVSRQNISSQQSFILNVKHLSSGVYFLQVSGEKNFIFDRKKFSVSK